MQLIESRELSSTASVISLENIPQDGVELVLLASVRSDDELMNMRVNNQAYDIDVQYLRGYNTVVFSALSQNQSNLGVLFVNGTGTTAGAFGNLELRFPDYAGSSTKSFFGSMVSGSSTTTNYGAILGGRIKDTAPITSMQFLFDYYQTFSSWSLYKITAD